MATRYPVYIISKGRADSRLTAKTLDSMGIPFRIVVEEQEYGAYSAVIDPARILILDPEYQRAYETCGSPDDTMSKGSGPARNFVWDHAIATGAERHWIMDDNIRGFYRLYSGRRILVQSDAAIRVMEDFVDRYTTVAMAGPNYYHFVNNHGNFNPIVPNTRIYSCILLRNDVPFRWRGRYNEDTILSLDMLKAGHATIQFNAILQNKMATQTMKGGNTDELYANGTLEKSKMLVREHPDVTRLSWKYDRWHHHVDYRRFKANRLIRRPDVEIPTEPNEYGMKLVNIAESRQAVAQ